MARPCQDKEQRLSCLLQAAYIRQYPYGVPGILTRRGDTRSLPALNPAGLGMNWHCQLSVAQRNHCNTQTQALDCCKKNRVTWEALEAEVGTAMLL